MARAQTLQLGYKIELLQYQMRVGFLDLSTGRWHEAAIEDCPTTKERAGHGTSKLPAWTTAARIIRRARRETFLGIS